MAGPESKVKDNVKALLKARGAWHYMVVPWGYSRNGVHDFIICYRGAFIAVETKKLGGKAQPWQLREHNAVLAAGGISIQVAGRDAVALLEDAFDTIDRQILRQAHPS